MYLLSREKRDVKEVTSKISMNYNENSMAKKGKWSNAETYRGLSKNRS